ncbi:MAG TPA: arabinan endo-1,5-alpha-L-arabinosidase, partial [Bacteroides reticulotermitis]|nr:arabinan endo-1,5-alpha-L-arabinosidase [Bacteroides reticulotermitis]
MRRSKDLVHWEFVGWAFPRIPEEAVRWVQEHADGQGATNIWAPYIIPYKNKYRLYYCVSAFGRKTSYIGLAEADSPEGPWTQLGCVAKTDDSTAMNAIDPSVIVDPVDGKWWMHYGSFFGGLYCMELNPETGLALHEGDLGHLVARRANYQKDNLEAPEIIYNPELKQYFLFTSYDPLMTTYNIRVSRSASVEDGFTDYFGKEVKDTTNNVPILTAPYRFENHPGWAGTAHCGVFSDGEGNYYLAHQGRLSPQNQLMVLHLRQLFFTPEGWPVVSPERYAGTAPRNFKAADLAGVWEVIRVQEPRYERQLEAGQILWGEGELKQEECNFSTRMALATDGTCSGELVDISGKLMGVNGNWSFLKDKRLLTLDFGTEKIDNLIIFAGHDWENETETVLFTGLDSRGRSVWGKRIMSPKVSAQSSTKGK